MASSTEEALESLRQLGSTDPPVWIAPKPELSEAVRAASKLLFACLKPHTPKSPFDQLLTDGFDAEQIWQQIDLQTQPLLSNLRREVKKFEKNPDEHFSLKDALGGGEKKTTGSKEIKEDDFDDMDLDMEDEDGDDDEDEDEDDDDEGTREKGGPEEKSGSEAEGESDEEDMERDSEGEENAGVEDKFLKIKHLQKYLEEDEAREYGYESKNKKAKKDVKIDNEEEEDGEDEEDADEEDELGLFNAHDDEDEDADKLENARYTDFFVANKRKASQKRSKLKDLSPDDEQETNKSLGNQRKDSLSTHEKELEKLQSKMKQMEQANLDAKVWTMQGEVTAAQRQKNSALEVHLDFEHNMRPAPVVTEEVTASIEDMIKNRVIEGRFDDVQKPPSLPSKAPREVKELDESKRKKGLAEVYEEEYVQKTDPAFTPLSFSDEQKKEASMLFKKLCLKLDALSHFHFTPKPVIEDMSIQVNVPALAMEEIAPVAISDAAMLAPEEVFAGKGDITEEAELTKGERKRRRANKKRKFKAEAAKRTVKKAGDRVLLNQSNGKGE